MPGQTPTSSSISMSYFVRASSRGLEQLAFAAELHDPHVQLFADRLRRRLARLSSGMT